jgi:hypothetical protein
VCVLTAKHNHLSIETVSSPKKTLNSKELVSCFDLQLNALLVGENYDVYIAAREMSNFT